MKNGTRSGILRLGMLLGAGAAVLAALPAIGSTVFAVTEGGALGRFDSSTPNSYVNLGQIAGLGADETIVGMDFRPLDGILYAATDGNNLYSLNTSVATATLVGSLSPEFTGSRFGFDFNPVADRLRLTNDSNQNLRCDPASLVCTLDGGLTFAAVDVNAGHDPNIVGSAYSSNVAGAATTVLYGIDSTRNALVRQDPPNDGTLSTVGALGVNTTDLVGFDIVTVGGVDVGYASLTQANVLSRFYTIDLQTGLASPVGGDDLLSLIGAGDQIRAIAVELTPVPLPAAGWLAVAGFAALGRHVRRRRSRIA